MNSCLVTKEALDIFSSLSGLRPNPSKSNMFITSLDEEGTLSVVSNLNIPHSNPHFLYLRVPLIFNRLKEVDLS